MNTKKKWTQPVLFKVLFLQDTSEHWFFSLTQTVQFLYTVYVKYFIPGSLISCCDAPITLKSCSHTKHRMFILCMRLFHVATYCVVWHQLKYIYLMTHDNVSRVFMTKQKHFKTSDSQSSSIWNQSVVVNVVSMSGKVERCCLVLVSHSNDSSSTPKVDGHVFYWRQGNKLHIMRW